MLLAFFPPILQNSLLFQAPHFLRFLPWWRQFSFLAVAGFRPLLETPMAGGTAEVIRLDEEIEGDLEGTADFLFFRIGAAVPLTPSGSGFDPKEPPKRPLAVSERFRVLFLAHSEGFLVAKTRDVIGLAKEIKRMLDEEKEKEKTVKSNGMLNVERENKVKEKPKQPSVQESSIIDVRIGKVSILALSTDSTTLAVTVGGEIQLFSVQSLLKKEQDPLLSCSLGESELVKDLRWCKNQDKTFIALSTSGVLYEGNLDGPLRNLMDNVDAVDWSLEGNFLAVARKNTLSILSSKFEEQLNLLLLFQSITDTDSGGFKVDSIKWLHNDTIIIGCTQSNEDDYFVQVISSRGHGFKASSKPVVVSFSNLFHGISGDLLTFGEGPHLLASYLERWGITLVANRKNMDDHVVLLELPVNGKRQEAVALELEQEKFTPRIELQENGDDNLILGFDVDKVSLYEQLEFIDNEEVKELLPYCILVCMSSEGKLIMFHITRISDPPVPLQAPVEVSDDTTIAEENSSAALPVSNESTIAISNMKNDEWVSSTDKLKQNCENPTEINGRKSVGNLDTSKENKGWGIFPQNNEKGSVGSFLEIPTGQPPASEQFALGSSHKQTFGNPAIPPTHSAFSMSSFGNNVTIKPSSVSNKLSGISDIRPLSSKESKDFIKQNEAGIGLTDSHSPAATPLGSKSSEKIISENHSAKFPSFVHSASPCGDTQDHGAIRSHFSTRQSFTTDISSGSRTSNSKGSSFSLSYQEGHRAATVRVENTGAISDVYGSAFVAKGGSVQGKSVGADRQTTPGNYKTYRSTDLELSRHFYGVDDMVKELDRLLLAIEGEGGFADACTIHLKNSVFALEHGLESLSDKSRLFKGSITEISTKIQNLQDKMVQISAREGYMEGIVKQASNNQYWDIWNRQKLGPEFELKQQQILKANQNLRNQLLELERHFNVLELNKFGECGVYKGRRAFNNSESSRRIQTIHRLHNTVNSQLVAAEHLSGCLSEQMAMLKIASPSVKRQSVAKELLESIGITNHADSFESPDVKGAGFSPDSSRTFLLSSSSASKEYARRNKSSARKGFEPETARRRRNSLDRSLAGFEPQKTTVKRILQQQGVRVSADKSSTANRNVLGSWNVGFSTSQPKMHENIAPSSLELSMYKFENHTYPAGRDLEEKSQKQSYESEPSPVFRWARDLSRSPEAVESKSLETPQAIQRINFQPPSSVVASPPIGSRFQNRTYEISSPTEKAVSEMSHTGGLPDISAVKFASALNTTAGAQTNMSMTSESFSKIASSIPPTKSPSLGKGKDQDQASRPVDFNGLNFVSNSVTVSASPGQVMLESSGKNQPSPSVAVDGNGFQVDALKNKTHTLETTVFRQAFSSAPAGSPVQSSSPLPSSNSLSSGSPVKPPTPTSTIAFGQSLNVSRTVIDTSQTTRSNSQPLSLNSTSQSLLSSPGPFSFLSQNSQVSSSFSSTTANATSQAPPHPTLIGSTCEKTVSLASTTNILAAVSSQSQSTSITPIVSATSPASTSPSLIASTTPQLSSATSKEKDDGSDIGAPQEDEMDEEAPETSAILNLGSLGGFRLGSTPAPSAPNPNLFGSSFGNAASSPATSPFSFSTPPGELFKPASFSLPAVQPAQSSPPLNPSGVSGGFSGFGQPAQIGAGQQALGSVLGAFGQSRLLGAGAQGIGFATPAGFTNNGFSAAAKTGGGLAATGGFAGASTGGFAGAASGGVGFAGAATGGGFAGIASHGGGFAGAATGGGFAGAATGGGFAALAASGSAFGAAASAGGGFGGAASGGFGSAAGAGKPPAELLMQMRK